MLRRLLSSSSGAQQQQWYQVCSGQQCMQFDKFGLQNCSLHRVDSEPVHSSKFSVSLLSIGSPPPPSTFHLSIVPARCDHPCTKAEQHTLLFNPTLSQVFSWPLCNIHDKCDMLTLHPTLRKGGLVTHRLVKTGGSCPAVCPPTVILRGLVLDISSN